jgi:hypothetical protein
MGFLIFLLIVAVIVVLIVVIIKNKRKKAEKELREKTEQEAREKAEEELREKERKQQEKEEKGRREKYKNDILSGAISYDGELQKIADKLSKYRPYLKEKALKMGDLGQGLSAGSSDAIYEIKNMSVEHPPFVDDELSLLSDIKYDARISALKEESSTLLQSYQELYRALMNTQSQLRLRGF